MPELTEAPFVDLFSDDFRANAPTIIEELRSKAPVLRTALGCMVIANDGVKSLLSDPRLGTALLPLIRMQGLSEGPIHDMVATAILAVDGVDHARLRRLVSRSFTPRATEPHKPLMRQLVDEFVDGFAADGRCEFMAAFADHYPISVMCHVLGVPTADHEKFARWGDDLTYVLSFEIGAHLDTINAAATGLMAYLDELIVDRRAAPRDDLVSELSAASEDGDRLTDLELRTLIASLLFAGYDTTRNQLGLALFTFADHLDQWKLLAERPELAAAAVDEVMRTAGVVSVTPRFSNAEIELDGWIIPAGTMVMLSLAAANHDPGVFPNPFDFDITATREAHLTFGGGPHYCLGASLARAEMQEALPILARRLPDLAIDGEPVWRQGAGIYGPVTLPITF